MTNGSAHRNFWAALCLWPGLPTISVTEWAKQHRVISRGVSHRHGRFKPLPMQVGPMDDVNDPGVNEIILCWAAQTAGKTEVIFSTIGYFIHADPSPQIYVLPTEKLAAEYSQDRIAPMIRDNPVLAKLISPARTRDSGNTVFSKTFPGGNLSIVGANAPAGLAGKPRRVILLDEVDRYPASAGKEGDPCALADKRAETYPNAVKIKTSTPTVKGNSRIWTALEGSDFQKWHCRCPRCDHEQVFAWSQVGWPDGQPEEAWIECANPACKAKLGAEDHHEMVKNGRWKPTQPFKGVRGYWLNGINVLLEPHKGYRNRLHEMAAEFLKAKALGSFNLRVWINTFLAECYEEATETIPAGELEKRAEDYTPETLPEGCLILVAAADVQADRIECEVCAVGRDDETWGVVKKVFYGDPEKNEVWDAFDAFLLNEKFTREDGVPLTIDRCLVDMGFKNRRVLEFCQPRLGRGIFACRGLNRFGINVPPLLPPKPSKNNRARIPHWNVGVTVAKQTIFDRLSLPLNEGGPTPRGMHFPKPEFGYDADHFKQLTSEKRKTRYSFGKAYSIFEKDNNAVRNEALDLAVYRLAAIESIGRINWNAVAENREKLRPKELEPVAPDGQAEQPAKVAVAPRRQSWATRW